MKRQTDYRQVAQAAEAKAKELWDAFTDSEKHGIRFGMFPAKQMREAEAAGVVWTESR